MVWELLQLNEIHHPTRHHVLPACTQGAATRQYIGGAALTNLAASSPEYLVLEIQLPARVELKALEGRDWERTASRG